MRTIYCIYGLIALALVGLAGTASATFTGPCTASVAGADLKTQDVVDVPAGSMVDYVFTAQQPVSNYAVALSYGPFDASPSMGIVEDGSTTVSGTVDLEQYAWMGVGLYTLQGNVVLEDGSACQGSININVQGNPLTTAAGGGAAFVAGVSTVALITMFLKGAGFIFLP